MANFGKSPEKSNFAQTCNLLSQYLKGKGTLGEINAKLEAKGAETTRPPTTTLDLLPSLGNYAAAESSKQNDMASSSTAKSMDFFTQIMASASSSKPVEDTINMVDSVRKSDTTNLENAPMTIFYAGKVIVFNDFPAEKAKEIMDLAGKASNNGFSPFVSTPSIDKFNCNAVTADLNKILEPEPQPLQLRPQDNASDLPIVRKNSLHQFLKKRNDRVAARAAPYERQNPGLPPKPDQEKKWLDL